MLFNINKSVNKINYVKYIVTNTKAILLSNKEQNIYNYFKNAYPNSFKYNGKRRPYLCKINFKNQIKYINAIYYYKTEDEIIQKILKLNKEYSKKDLTWFPSKGKINNKELIQKIHSLNLLYLGLLPNNWYKQINNIPKYNSEIKISQSLRQQIWVKYIGKKYETLCSCCNINIINCFTFECGHIVAHSKGGLCNINNLIPICGVCNKSMGNMNLNLFKNKYMLNMTSNKN